MTRLLALAALLFALPAHSEVTIEWVTVRDPDNAGDPQESCVYCGPGTVFGDVPYGYRIGKFEVTNAEYVEFLNAVAATDTYALYSPEWPSSFGGIKRHGDPGIYTYSLTAGRENWPVNHVTFWDAARFANWLHNGQPTGAQDDTTTEDGAYTLTPDGIANDTVTRNPDARFFIPSTDEWYKAAYYDPVAKIYHDYPAGSDTEPACTWPGAAENTANCDNAWGGPDDVGSYTGSPSPNGTFGQTGNLQEWAEDRLGPYSGRSTLGGDFGAPAFLAASWQNWGGGGNPLEDDQLVGFRVASAQYPYGIPALTSAGLLVVAVGLLGFGAYRRVRA